MGQRGNALQLQVGGGRIGRRAGHVARNRRADQRNRVVDFLAIVGSVIDLQIEPRFPALCGCDDPPDLLGRKPDGAVDL